MSFAEDTEVIYKGRCGVIDFVWDTYVVIKLSPAADRNPPRLVVFRHNYKNIVIAKASTNSNIP